MYFSAEILVYYINEIAQSWVNFSKQSKVCMAMAK
jgi:hypothetical protein